MNFVPAIAYLAFAFVGTLPAFCVVREDEVVVQEQGDLRGLSQPSERRSLGPAAHDLWCEGRILLRDGSPTPVGMRITGRGARWPDGSDSREVPVTADGCFRVAMAPGTRLGVIHLQAEGHLLAVPGIWRPWFKKPMHLTPYQAMRFRLQVIDGGKSPRGAIRVSRVTASLLDDIEEVSLSPQEDGGFLDRPARFYNISYLVGAEGRANVRVQGPKENKDRTGQLTVTLHEPARLSGRVAVTVLGESQRLWMSCSQPFQSLLGGPEIALQEDGSFDLCVPAGVEIRLTAGAKGHDRAVLRLSSLRPGEHCGGLEINLQALPGLKGCVVDGAGKAVAGAYVQSLVLLPSEFGSPRDAGMGPMHQTMTDSLGNFTLLGLHDFESVPLEVTVSSDPNFRLGGSVLWPAGQVSQHYENVAVGEQRRELVFQPRGSRLVGRVQDADGGNLPEFVVLLASQGHRFVSKPVTSPSCEVKLDSSPLLSTELSLIDHGQFLNERRYQVSNSLGRFDLSHLPAGQWAMSIEVDGVVVRKVGPVTLPRGADLALRLPRSSDVEVSLVDDTGVAWAGCRVRIYPYDPCEVQANPGLAFLLGSRALGIDRTAVSGAQGRVTFEDLPEGQYRVLCPGPEGRLLSPKQLHVRGGGLQKVELRAQAQGSIRGGFRWKGAGGRVYITLKQEGRFVQSEVIEYRAGFLMPGVAPGSYELHFTAAPGPDGIEGKIAPVGVQVLAGETTHVLLER